MWIRREAFRFHLPFTKSQTRQSPNPFFNPYVNNLIPSLQKLTFCAHILAGHGTPVLLYKNDMVLLSRLETGLCKVLNLCLLLYSG